MMRRRNVERIDVSSYDKGINYDLAYSTRRNDDYDDDYSFNDDLGRGIKEAIEEYREDVDFDYAF